MKKYYAVNVEVDRSFEDKPRYFLIIKTANKSWWFGSWLNGDELNELKLDPQDREKPLMVTKYFDTPQIAEQWAYANIPNYEAYAEYLNAQTIKWKIAIRKYYYSKTIIIKTK